MRVVNQLVVESSRNEGEGFKSNKKKKNPPPTQKKKKKKKKKKPNEKAAEPHQRGGRGRYIVAPVNEKTKKTKTKSLRGANVKKRASIQHHSKRKPLFSEENERGPCIS